jgi:hypothetical protein
LKKSRPKNFHGNFVSLLVCGFTDFAGDRRSLSADKKSKILKIESSLSFSKSYSFYGLHLRCNPRKIRKPEIEKRSFSKAFWGAFFSKKARYRVAVPRSRAA